MFPCLHFPFGSLSLLHEVSGRHVDLLSPVALPLPAASHRDLYERVDVMNVPDEVTSI